jgi:probable rRNA maturation factor
VKACGGLVKAQPDMEKRDKAAESEKFAHTSRKKGNPSPAVFLDIQEPLWIQLFPAQQWKRFIRQCAQEVFCCCSWPVRTGISVVLGQDDLLLKLNQHYRNKSAPTNILSFPQLHFSSPCTPASGESVPKILGDLALSYNEVLKGSKLLGVQDHTFHLFVHGILHLLGYNHEYEEEATLMEAKEVEVLKNLGKCNPYALFEQTSCP